jgi:hypothetical protein
VTWEQEGRDWLLNFDDERGRRARVMPFGGGWDAKVFGGDGEVPVFDYRIFPKPEQLEAAKRWAEARVAGQPAPSSDR